MHGGIPKYFCVIVVIRIASRNPNCAIEMVNIGLNGGEFVCTEISYNF